MTDVLTLPVAERDRLAAIHVMGWRRIERSTYGGKVPAWYDDAKKMEINYPHFAFCPSSDANDDYLILQKVRGEWSRERQTAFVVALRRLLDSRARQAFGISITESLDTTWVLLYYEPGDYRDSSLIVLAEKGVI